MKKILKVSFIILLILQISMINVLSGRGQVAKENIRPSIPEIYIDLSKTLQEMGYTSLNVSNISSDLLNSVLLEYCQENPYGYTTEKPQNFDLDESNYVGDPKNEYDSPSEFSSRLQENSQNSILLTETKACVTCAVWDYPGDEQDLGWYMQQAAEDHLYEHAEDDGDYNIVYTNLENSVANRNSIDTVLDYFFDTYDNVDLYFLGHGSRAYVWYMGFWQYKSYYLPYDAIDEDGDTVISNVFWEYELPSTNPLWDASPMRMVMFVACRDWEFRQEALTPGGSTSHDRAFCGFNGVGYTMYAYYYMVKWCDLWYQNGWDSSSAASDARDYAWGYDTSGVNMSYADTGSYIYC